MSAGIGVSMPRQVAGQASAPESQIKLAHRLTAASITDDDLLFLRQLGLKWVRRIWRAPGHLRRAPGRTAALRPLRHADLLWRTLLLSISESSTGQPGRDQDIETYCEFIRNLGRLNIPVALYDFHPGNTYTTSVVERRGYAARQFDLDTFRKTEKQEFGRDYLAEKSGLTTLTS